MKPLSLFIAAVCLGFVCPDTAAQTVHHCLNGQTEQKIPITPAAGNYVEADIRFKRIDFSHSGISADWVSGRKRKNLFHNQTTAQNFLLWLPDHNAGYLHIRAGGQPHLCYSLTLKYSRARVSDNKPPQPSAVPDSPRLRAVFQADDRHRAADRFWQYIGQHGAPLIEPVNPQHVLLTFLYRGARHNVRLIGAPSNDHEWLVQLPDTDIWYKSFIVPADTRLSYRLAPDIPTPAPQENSDSYRNRRALLSVIQTDPLNPHRYGRQSLLDLNTAAATVLPAPRGNLRQYAFKSRILNNERRIWLYRNQTENTGQPVFLYLFDGQDYLDDTRLLSLLDRLPASMPPVYTVLIDNHDRRRELPANEKFADMLVQELIPFVGQKSHIAHRPQRSILSGSSYGGLATVYTVYRYPKAFHYAVPLSGSFWWQTAGDSRPNGIRQLFLRQHTGSVNWYIAAGRYETGRNGTGDGILETSRDLADTLQQQGNHIVFHKFSGGHDYVQWEQILINALMYFFDGQKEESLPVN